MDEIDVLGVPVPNAGPLFLAALGFHVVAGLTCVASGAVTALSRKGGLTHVRSGRVYFWGLTMVFATMTVMSVIRWRENAHLFALGVLAYTAGSIGYLDRRRAPGRETVHIAAMGLSYVTLLTAFYVDNGQNLPGWDRLPAWSFWILPGLIGFPLTVRAIRRRVKEMTDGRAASIRRPYAGRTEEGTDGRRPGTAQLAEHENETKVPPIEQELGWNRKK